MNTNNRERWFLSMYDTEADAVFRFCLVKLRDREAAVEITQDTFTRIWEYISRGETVRNARAFAFRVARNAIADYVKKSRPLYEHDLGEAAERIFEIAVSGDAELQAELSGLLRCLAGLPDDDRELVALRYTEGMPVKDIATERGERPNTITVRLKRALESLRECLGVPARAQTS